LIAVRRPMIERPRFNRNGPEKPPTTHCVDCTTIYIILLCVLFYIKTVDILISYHKFVTYDDCENETAVGRRRDHLQP